ncbi:MAG: ThuA domain-containing protein [Planctomycetia bacterium]|nr:ThuA domain-containing protein [Planctomycetia bacterium]
MKKYILTLILLLGSALCFSQEPATQQLQLDFNAITTCQAGADNGLRSRLETLLYTQELNDEGKAELRRNLVAIFRDSTLDGQRLLYRVLWPSLDEETALPLLPLLTDASVDPETAKMTLMMLQTIPGEKIDAALLQATNQVQGDLLIGLIGALGSRKMNAAVPRLAELIQQSTNEKNTLTTAPLIVDAAIHALTQMGSDEALNLLEILDSQKKLPLTANDALVRIRESKQPELQETFLPAPYDPDLWPGDVQGKQMSVDFNQVVAERQAAFLAETDPVKKNELALLFASKAALLTEPAPAFTIALQKSQNLNEQKTIITAMGEKCYTPDVIDLAKSLMKDNRALRPAAGLALVRMANSLRRTDSATAKDILNTVRQQVQNDDIIKRASAVLSTIGRNEGSIRNWLYTGPFTIEGKSGEEVFRHTFPAEADRPETPWQLLVLGWQGGNRWNLEVGIEPCPHAAACLKTYIWSDIEQELVFQAASTGGVAAWCDKNLIVNQWYDGPFEQWTFSAPIHLKKGYNTLVVKTMCTDKGWNFSARLRTKDDQNPDNIRIESTRKETLPKVLLFTGTQSWVHAPTAAGPHGNSCAELTLKEVCRELGFQLVWTDSGEIFNCPLDDYAAFIFYTCGELNEEGNNGLTPVNKDGMLAFLNAIRERGTGLLAIHSASDSWHKWPEYITLIGAEFVQHGMQQEAAVNIVTDSLPNFESILGKSFRHFEEWYSFRNFNPDIHVLMMQDTAGMNTDGMSECYKQAPYPCTWTRAEGNGIVAFTSLGHSCEVWRTAEYRALLTDLLSIVTHKHATDLTPNFNSFMNKE